MGRMYKNFTSCGSARNRRRLSVDCIQATFSVSNLTTNLVIMHSYISQLPLAPALFADQALS
jgi:hypothetical protein